MRGRYKKWALPFLEEHPDIAIETIDMNSPFFACPISLEIGAGKGDFALGFASKNPDKSILALERDISIAGIFAKKVNEREMKNVRITAQDFDSFYSSLLEGPRYETIFLNFSDPWPKKKHAKRRLTTRGRLLQMVALLKPNGEIRFKSDNDILYAFTQEEIAAAGLEVISDEEDYAFDESSDFMSEYERNFRSVGKKIHRIVFKKANKETER